MNLLDTTDIGISYDDLSSLILTIGGCIALVGAVVIYRKWSMGGHNIENDVMMWGGGVLMLLIVKVFIAVMFSV